MCDCQKSRTVSTVLPGRGFMASSSFGGPAGGHGLALAERREPRLDADHLPEQEVVPAEALVGLRLEHSLDELGIEDTGGPEPARCEHLPGHEPQVLLVLLDGVEGEPPL